jgi:hypothetical protein
MNRRVQGGTYAVLSPEKPIKEPIVFSLRNVIVVRSLSVQIDSSTSLSLDSEEMRGKTYSAKVCSAAALGTYYENSLMIEQTRGLT